MQRITIVFLSFVAVACATYLLWPGDKDQAADPTAESKVELPPLEETPAYQRLLDAQGKPLIPLGGTPEQRIRAWEQRMAQTVATLEAEKRVREELDFEIPDRLRELSPEAAARLERSNEMHDKWQEHRRDQIRKLEKLEPVVRGAQQ